MPQVGDKIQVKRELGRRWTEYVEGTITKVCPHNEYWVLLPGSPYAIIYRQSRGW